MPAIGQGNLKFHKAYRALVTVGEMMTDRSYLVADNVIPASFDEFMERYVAKDVTGGLQNQILRRDKMTLACERRRDESGLTSSTAAGGVHMSAESVDPNLSSSVTGGVTERATVVFVGVDNFTTTALKSLVQQASSSEWNCKTLICVLPNKPGVLVRRAAEAVSRSKQIKVELFEEDDLAVNITHHELVPKHVPLQEGEVREVLQAYAIQKHQLPRILTTDPVAAYFGLERGQVVRIERKSASAGIYVTYRQVA